MYLAGETMGWNYPDMYIGYDLGSSSQEPRDDGSERVRGEHYIGYLAH